MTTETLDREKFLAATGPRAAYVCISYVDLAAKLGLPPGTRICRVVDAGNVQMQRLVAVEIEAPYLPQLWQDSHPMQTYGLDRLLGLAADFEAMD